MKSSIMVQWATTRIYQSGRMLAALTGLALMACSVLPATASLNHYWTLDTNTNAVPGGTGYEDTGSAPVKVGLWAGPAHNTTSQKVGSGAATFPSAPSELRQHDNQPNTLTPSNLTCAVWVKRTGDWGTGEHTIVSAKDWASWNGNGWYLTIDNGGTRIIAGLSGNQQFAYNLGTQIFALDMWVHVAMTFNSTTKAQAIYINGSPVTTVVWLGTPDAIVPTNPEFRLAHNMYWTGSSLAPAELDDVGIWNENLSATRIKALYNLANTAALAYGQMTSATLFSGFDTGTADDGVADVTIAGVKWFKVSAGIGGSDGDVVALAGGGYGLNLGGGAGMMTAAYTVTYNDNGSTGGSAPVDGSGPYSYGAPVTVLGNTGDLTRTGFTFANWNTAVDASGINYSGGSTFAITASTTLYAKWVVAGVDHFAITGIGATQTAGAPITGFTITAQDAANNTMTNFTSAVTFGGTAGGTGSSPAFTAGVCTTASVTPTIAGSDLTITVDDGAGHTGTTTVATVNPGAASQFVIDPNPIASATAGTPFAITSITAKDINGNACTTGPNVFTGTVDFSGTAGITGTSSSFSGGVLASPSVTVTNAGSGKTIVVTQTGGSATGSATITTVTPGAPANMALTSGNNQNGTVGTALAEPFVVTVTDASGNRVSGASVTFAVTTTPPPGSTGEALSTTNATTVSNGQASSTLIFGNLPGTYTVAATLGSITGSPMTFTAHAYSVQMTYDADTGTAGAQDGAGTGWDGATANWWDGVSSNVVWPNMTTLEAIIGAGNGAAATINVTGTRTLNKLTFNRSDSGTYTLSGGTLSFGGTTPAITANAAAMISSVVQPAADLTIGGPQELTLSGGIDLGGADRRITVSNTGNTTLSGALSNSGGFFFKDGLGILSLTGISAITGRLYVDRGTLLLSGTGSLTVNGAWNDLGGNDTYSNGQGGIQAGEYVSMTVKDSAAFSTPNDFNIHEGVGGTAILNIQDSGTVTSGNTWVGKNPGDATGVVNQVGGTFTINGFCDLGATPGKEGIYNLSAGTLIVRGANGLRLGYRTWDGNQNAGNGTVTQTGGLLDATTVVLGTQGAGKTSTGTYFLNGGTLFTGGIAKGSNVASTVALNFGGGTLKAKNDLTLEANVPTTINDGGATVDSNSRTVTIKTPLLAGTGSGGLTKIGVGTLALGATSTYSGPTAVSNGTLRLTTESCLSTNTAVTIAAGAVLNLDFTGTNTIRSLRVGDRLLTRGRVYDQNQAAVSGYLTGNGALKTLEGPSAGTFIAFF